MAKIIGGLTTSHVPAIGGAIARGVQQEPYWKPFFDGFLPVRAWLDEVKPDVAVVFYNDHGLNFFLDKMPTFAVGAAPEYRNADEGWGIPTLPPFKGNLDLSWHVINHLVDREFDIVTCQEMLVTMRSRCRSSCFGPRAPARCRRCRCASTPCSFRCPAPNGAWHWARRWARPSPHGTATSVWW